MADKDKPFDFGSFSNDHNKEQERANQKAVTLWLWAFHEECKAIGFTPEEALALTRDRSREFARAMLQNFLKKPSSGDEAS